MVWTSASLLCSNQRSRPAASAFCSGADILLNLLFAILVTDNLVSSDARCGAIQYNLAFELKLMIDSAHTIEAPATAGKTLLDINEIQKILPHRYPFLLIDRVLELVRKERIVALKNVTINEPFFAGHFPGAPIMPGVLIIEAIAQAGGALLLTEVGDRENKLMVFTSIERAKFRKPVVPGDQLRLEVKVIGWRAVRNMVAARMEGIASVDGRKVAEAIVGCQLIDSSKGRAGARDDADTE